MSRRHTVNPGRKKAESDESILASVFETVAGFETKNIELAELLKGLRTRNAEILCLLSASPWLRPLCHPKGLTREIQSALINRNKFEISLSEFSEIWESFRPNYEPLSDESCQALFTLFDTIDQNNDGCLLVKKLRESLHEDVQNRALIASSEELASVLQDDMFEYLTGSKVNGTVATFQDVTEYVSLISRSDTSWSGLEALTESIFSGRENNSGWPIEPFKHVSHVPILQLSEYLKVDPNKEPSLLWIVRQALETDIPPDWKLVSDSPIKFENEVTGETILDHPAKDYFLDLIDHERQQSQVHTTEDNNKQFMTFFIKNAEETNDATCTTTKSLRKKKADNYIKYYYNFTNSKIISISPETMFEGEVMKDSNGKINSPVAQTFSIHQSTKKGNFNKHKTCRKGRGRNKEVPIVPVLCFKSWWNEVTGDTLTGTKKRYLDILFHTKSGGFQIIVEGAKCIYTMSHINGLSKPIECWDLFVGAKINILGRKTTLMQADSDTISWNEYHHSVLKNVWEKLKESLAKYDALSRSTSFMAKLKVPVLPKATMAHGKVNLRAYLEDINLLKRKLEDYRPKVAKSIVKPLATYVFTYDPSNDEDNEEKRDN